MLMQTHEARLAALREELKRRGLDGFVVPLSDEHLSEYVGEYAQRLAWLTGFGGSAGTAVVLTRPGPAVGDADGEKGAAIFVDGRYTLQVREQVDGRHWDYQNIPDSSPARWLKPRVEQGARIGYDPWLHSGSWADATRKTLAEADAELVAVDSNPIDAVWQDQPLPSVAPALVHDENFAGMPSAEKRVEVAEWLVKQHCDAVVITALDSIAWLLNIRGTDVARTPVTLAFAIMDSDADTDLFIADEKVTDDLRTHLGSGVTIRPRAAFTEALAALGGKTVAVDPNLAVVAIIDALETAGAEVRKVTDPTVLPKAIKNAAEQAGHRAAQARDGAALARFLHWIAREAPQGGITELAAADRLEACRTECGDLRDLSFDTISGAGPNGAVVHYRVSEETNRALEPDSVYLVDSGGQYPDGTTDVTRTVWVGPGEAPDEVKDRFTRVLKGHIALARAVFPVGTTGSQLDTLARQYLWAAGLDYAHGTGHGVGSFLSVHEGPQRISRVVTGRDEPALQAGMIVSNEPGYYKAGEYGIRIENLVLVEERNVAGAEHRMLGFETLTHAPIDRALIDNGLLDPGERTWLDGYHARVIAVVGPQLGREDLDWLHSACAPLGA